MCPTARARSCVTRRGVSACGTGGAVLHWLYFTDCGTIGPSGASLCCGSRRDGLVVYRCRGRPGTLAPRARYRSGRMSPYHGTIHWHHVLGLIAAVPLCTWIVSGWMSLEPGQWVSDRAIDRMSERYTALDRSRLLHDPARHRVACGSHGASSERSPVAVLGRQAAVCVCLRPDHRQLISGYDRPAPVAIGGPESWRTRPNACCQTSMSPRSPCSTPMISTGMRITHRVHCPCCGCALMIRKRPGCTLIRPRVMCLSYWIRRDAGIASSSMPCIASISLVTAHRPAWDLVVITLCGLGLALSVTAVAIAWRRLQP